MQKVVQCFSFAGQICFRSDVNTNYLYLLMFTTDVSSATICHCQPWEQWRQSNDMTQATAQSMTFIAIFLQLDEWNNWKLQYWLQVQPIVVDLVMYGRVFVRKSIIHLVWSEWTCGPSLVWGSQLTPSPTSSPHWHCTTARNRN